MKSWKLRTDSCGSACTSVGKTNILVSSLAVGTKTVNNKVISRMCLVNMCQLVKKRIHLHIHYEWQQNNSVKNLKSIRLKGWENESASYEIYKKKLYLDLQNGKGLRLVRGSLVRFFGETGEILPMQLCSCQDAVYPNVWLAVFWLKSVETTLLVSLQCTALKIDLVFVVLLTIWVMVLKLCDG